MIPFIVSISSLNISPPSPPKSHLVAMSSPSSGYLYLYFLKRFDWVIPCHTIRIPRTMIENSPTLSGAWTQMKTSISVMNASVSHVRRAVVQDLF